MLSGHRYNIIVVSNESLGAARKCVAACTKQLTGVNLGKRKVTVGIPPHPLQFNPSLFDKQERSSAVPFKIH